MPRPGGLFERILYYKFGDWQVILVILVLFIGAVVFVRYKATGRVDIKGMIDPDGEARQPFWARNPQLEFVDSIGHTSLLVARERETGKQMLLDMRVVGEAKLTVRE